MVTLYQNYVTTVKDSVTGAARNDLKLYLFEGKTEIKTNPLTTLKDVYQYGTATLATPVYDRYGVALAVLAADPINRPGEYEFAEVDLTINLSGEGQTLYSVIGRPAADSDFENALVITQNFYISDPNLKQTISAAFGGLTNVADNMFFAGGTVDYEQYSTAVTNNSVQQHIKLNGLTSAITDLYEYNNTDKPGFSDGYRLTARFNVYYSAGSPTRDNVIWESVPAWRTAAGDWLLLLRADQYCTWRSSAFGSSPLIDMAVVVTNLVVSVNLVETNCYIRRFRTSPTVAIPTTGQEAPGLVVLNNGTERIVGIGSFDFSSNTPANNLDVLGNIGARITIGTNERLFINTSYAAFGWDTAGDYFKVESQRIRMYSDAATVLDIQKSINSFKAGPDLDGSPNHRLYMVADTYTDVAVSSNSYFRQTLASGVTAKTEYLAAAVPYLEATVGATWSTRFGYATDVVGSGAYFYATENGAGATTAGIRIYNYDRLAAATSTTIIRHSGTAPFFKAEPTIIGLYNSASTSYVRLTATSVDINGIVNSGSSVVFTANNTDNVRVGYAVDDTATMYGLHSSSSYTILRIPGAVVFNATTTSVLLGLNTSVYPYIQLNSSSVCIYGSATSYLSVTPLGAVELYANSVRTLSSSVAGTSMTIGYSTAFSTYTAGQILISLTGSSLFSDDQVCGYGLITSSGSGTGTKLGKAYIKIPLLESANLPNTHDWTGGGGGGGLYVHRDSVTSKTYLMFNWGGGSWLKAELT